MGAFPIMKLFLGQLQTHNYYCKPTESAGDETTPVDHTIPNQPSSPTRTLYPPVKGPSHKRSTRKATRSGSRFEHIRRQTTLMLTPPKKLAPAPTFSRSVKAILMASCELIFASTIRSSLNRPGLNLLLVCIPISVSVASLEAPQLLRLF